LLNEQLIYEDYQDIQLSANQLASFDICASSGLPEQIMAGHPEIR
jgi:hypothetical protein